MTKRAKSIGVHDGMFHADEVTACALLVHCGLADIADIIRTRDPDRLNLCEFVCDVGGIYDPEKKLFDHHQATYRGPMSSAGMVLLYLKEHAYLSEQEYFHLHNSLVLGVDEHDNGRSKQIVGVTTFSHVIANFSPASYQATEKELGEAFHAALEFTIGHLSRLLARYHYNHNCRELVQKAMEPRGVCLFFEESIPWVENFFALGGEKHPALFVIMPAKEHWKVRGIPPTLDRRMEVRVPLPGAWAGLLGDDLKKASNIEGGVFCHKGRFTSVWETREDALQALKYVLTTNGIEHEDVI